MYTKRFNKFKYSFGYLPKSISDRFWLVHGDSTYCSMVFLDKNNDYFGEIRIHTNDTTIDIARGKYYGSLKKYIDL